MSAKYPKVNRYNYYLVIQGNYGYGHGWEDESQYDESKRDEVKQARQDLKEYRLSRSGGVYRLIHRRELNPLSIKNHVAFVNGEIG